MHDENHEKRRGSFHVLMAGGGTGGHVFPALAIAAELAERGGVVSWIGRAESMEESIVRAADLPFHALEAKPWVGKGLLAKAGAAGTLAVSSLKARRLLRSLAGDVALGTGGYVSTPALLGARMMGMPAFLLEPNAVAGAANRFASRWCKAAFVAHEETARQLRCDALVTGIPVRGAFHEVEALPVGEPRCLVLGGSQGARQINELVPQVVRQLGQESGLDRIRITHQTGRSNLAEVRAAYVAHGLTEGSSLEIVPFIDDMAGALSRAQLVISRAGALATAEIGAAGRPAILIPLAGAGAGHQRFNADRMTRAGAAVTLADEDVTAENLGRAMIELLTDRSRLESMARAASAMAIPGAAAQIADVLERAGEAA